MKAIEEGEGEAGEGEEGGEGEDKGKSDKLTMVEVD
jgi:hypothetical protein